MLVALVASSAAPAFTEAPTRSSPTVEEMKKMAKTQKKNERSVQKNPNNDRYYKDRGYKGGKKEYAKKHGF